MKPVYFLFVVLFCSNCRQQTEKKIPEQTSDTISKFTATFRPYYWIFGDFNGDKQIDTIRELFLSRKTNKGTQNKFYAEHIRDVQKHLNQIKPSTRIVGTNAPSDTFVLSDENNQIGLWLFENLGDLDGDGADEIGYSINYADASLLNAYVILSYKNEWSELAYFTIHEELNMQSSGQFKNGKLTRKSSDNKIEVYFYDAEKQKIKTKTIALKIIE
ncbi:MAG: hypothetical protein CBB99_04435 [Bacteroidetes bacterium TMED39]|nr:MAG: hypothetical protein CBB99_04435 [Bacteroidetes bacterium TMED39]|tara:strand:+ start:5800 stop:6447 length:648 start_codon:yes stop_codon:yes gene_type:complete